MVAKPHTSRSETTGGHLVIAGRIKLDALASAGASFFLPCSSSLDYQVLVLP